VVQSQLPADVRECAELCEDCHRICIETAAHCLAAGGKHSEARHVRLLLDCAEICQTSANFMARGSDLHHHTCAACAEVCDRCAESCERIGDDETMRQCADLCRRCADSCRRMSGTT
jgi:hypothetical protein